MLTMNLLRLLFQMSFLLLVSPFWIKTVQIELMNILRKKIIPRSLGKEKNIKSP